MVILLDLAWRHPVSYSAPNRGVLAVCLTRYGLHRHSGNCAVRHYLAKGAELTGKFFKSAVAYCPLKKRPLGSSPALIAISFAKHRTERPTYRLPVRRTGVGSALPLLAARRVAVFG